MEREDEKNERREGGGEAEAGARNPDWIIRGSNAPGLEHPGAEALDWNVREGSGPAVERPGPQMEEEMAAERSDEEHLNSMDQHGPDGEGEDGREKGSGRKRSKRKSGQPRGTRTRTSGGAAHQGRYIRGRGGHGKERPELQEEGEAAAATIARGKDACTRVRVGGERGREEQEKGRGRRRRSKHVEPGLDHPGKQSTQTGTTGGRKPGTGASGEAAAWDWTVRGSERRGIR